MASSGELEDTRKSVLITGAGVDGIGGALAKEFHAKGFRVFATARRLQTVSELEKLGIETIYLDVTKTSDVYRVRDEVAARTGGKLDVLVNNAGVNLTMPAIDLDIDHAVKELFEVNVFGVMRMVQGFIHLLIAAEGTIVNIGSVAAVLPFVFGSAYNATKGALHAYGNSLRVELKPFNVDVMTVITGGVTSQIARTPRTLPPGSLYSPISDAFQARVGFSQRGAMPAATYAKGVVAQVMKSKYSRPIWYWKGNMARFTWFFDTFLWKGAWDYRMMKKFGLLNLQKWWVAMRRAKNEE